MRRLRIPIAICTAMAVAVTTIGATTPAASPSTSPSSSPALPFLYRMPYTGLGARDTWPKLVFVFAIGADPGVRQKVVATLTREMQRNEQKVADVNGQKPVKFVPEPDWGVPDYIGACQPADDKNPSDLTAGALIAGLDSVSNFTETAYVYRTNVTELKGTLFYSICPYGQPATRPTPTRTPLPAWTPLPKPYKLTKLTIIRHMGRVTTITRLEPTPTPKPSPSPSPPVIVWQTNIIQGNGGYGFPTLLPILGLLGAAVSAWTAFTPSVVKSTINTYAYPTPPAGPPPGGSVTQSQTTNSKTTNASQLGGVATGFLGSSLLYDASQTGINTADRQTRDAVSHLVGQFMDVLQCPVNDTPTRPRDQRPDLSKPQNECRAVLNGMW
jgi:hypothetical protein